MKKPFVIGGIIVFVVVFLGVGFLFHSDCKTACDQQPAYWYGIAVPQTQYNSFYDTSPSGASGEEPQEEEAPHTNPSQPQEMPPDEEPPEE